MLKFKLLLALFGVLFAMGVNGENLYRGTDYVALTADHRAHQIGDVITVLVVESSTATATAGTTTDKSNDIGIRFASPTSQKNYAAGLESNFDGNGKIARSGKLLAQLSVSVIQVMSNGDLQVSGEQLIEINGEKQAINLEGRVRLKDIDEGNTVLSNRIANAHITYIGDGVLAENQHKGWLSRLITLLGLL